MDYLDTEHEGLPTGDAVDKAAYTDIKAYIKSNPTKVFFGREIEVFFEDKYFHWITSRVLRELSLQGVINREARRLKWGGNIMLYWNKSFRYYKKAALNTISLVERYSEDIIGSTTGAHGELLVVEGFAKLKFVLAGREVNEYNGKKWTKTGHNLDMIVERDGVAYGVEVKNTLSYIDKEEYEVKLLMCQHLGILPVFVVRFLPKNWTSNIIRAGGFALILKYLLYPELLKDLANDMRTQFSLPVDTPRSLYEGTLKRFENWHLKKV